VPWDGGFDRDGAVEQGTERKRSWNPRTCGGFETGEHVRSSAVREDAHEHRTRPLLLRRVVDHREIDADDRASLGLPPEARRRRLASPDAESPFRERRQRREVPLEAVHVGHLAKIPKTGIVRPCEDEDVAIMEDPFAEHVGDGLQMRPFLPKRVLRGECPDAHHRRDRCVAFLRKHFDSRGRLPRGP
jgi:hypothetical protein